MYAAVDVAVDVAVADIVSGGRVLVGGDQSTCCSCCRFSVAAAADSVAVADDSVDDPPIISAVPSPSWHVPRLVVFQDRLAGVPILRGRGGRCHRRIWIGLLEGRGPWVLAVAVAVAVGPSAVAVGPSAAAVDVVVDAAAADAVQQ